MNKPAEFPPRTEDAETVPAWINGAPVVPGGRFGDVFNPATGRVTKKVAFADGATIDAAVRSAAAAFPAWRDTPPVRRARVLQEFLALLKKNQKELAALVTAEHGKTLPDAMGSVQRGMEVVEFACGIPHLLKGEHSENVGTQ
ncbi:MAG TPA: aldehyde dehydrogenase family protein, partial [Burkholderiales bacterium]|nr:aldehyde dehydrogenase family protein [Burkholderiales bacterium]